MSATTHRSRPAPSKRRTAALGLITTLVGGFIITALGLSIANPSSIRPAYADSGTGPLFVAIDAGSATGAAPFVADTNYQNGNKAAFSDPIDTSGVSNPAPQEVYQTERYAKTQTSFTYTIPVPAGVSYIVRLHFAELFYNVTTGQRQFNVSINGTQVLTNFDVYHAAGDMSDKAVIETFSAGVSNGNIVIVFSDGATGAAEVNGIEIYNPPPTPTPTNTPTNTPTSTPTNTSTSTPTSTPTSVPTNTATSVPTATPTATNTPVPPTSTTSPALTPNPPNGTPPASSVTAAPSIPPVGRPSATPSPATKPHPRPVKPHPGHARGNSCTGRLIGTPGRNLPALTVGAALMPQPRMASGTLAGGRPFTIVLSSLARGQRGRINTVLQTMTISTQPRRTVVHTGGRSSRRPVPAQTRVTVVYHIVALDCASLTFRADRHGRASVRVPLGYVPQRPVRAILALTITANGHRAIRTIPNLLVIPPPAQPRHPARPLHHR